MIPAPRVQSRTLRALAVALAGAATLSIAACGANAKPSAQATPTPSPTVASPTPTPSPTATIDPNRPTPQQIVNGLQKELAFPGQLASQMPCIGRAFYDSTLSDDALSAIAGGNTSYSPSPDDERALVSLLATAVEACSPDATPTASPTS